MQNIEVANVSPEVVIEAVREVTAKLRRLNEKREVLKLEDRGTPTWELTPDPWDESTCPF